MDCFKLIREYQPDKPQASEDYSDDIFYQELGEKKETDQGKLQKPS
jgi:hypothetical protein